MRAHPGSDPRNIGDVRTALLRFLARQRELALAYDLPNPPTIVDLIRERLADETCTILILGEANKGKSTFANAIVGRPGLIPEGIDRHTSQAFRVRLAEREAYRVRYEDDSSEMLTRDELSTIGTQSLTGEGTFGHDGRIVRYIEIDIAPDPARPLPLPPEVVLIDTPGLGTLNAAHAQVTQRFLPLADAVIFVLDSDAPVLTPELEIIATVLETTSHILFVQTKLGDAGEAKWRENQRRNEEILTGRFGAQLGKIAVWPIDSLVLQQALARGNKGMERASHFPEFLAAFKRFLDRAVVWGRCVNAALAAQPYQDYGNAQLARRLQDFDLVGAGDHAQALVDLESRRAAFLADWGEAGRKRGELLAKVANDTSAANSRMRLALEDPHLSNPAPDHMSVPVLSKIAAIQTVEDAKVLADNELGLLLSTGAADRWWTLCAGVELRLAEHLLPLAQAVAELDLPLDEGLEHDSAADAPIPDLGSFGDLDDLPTEDTSGAVMRVPHRVTLREPDLLQRWNPQLVQAAELLQNVVIPVEWATKMLMKPMRRPKSFQGWVVSVGLSFVVGQVLERAVAQFLSKLPEFARNLGAKLDRDYLARLRQQLRDAVPAMMAHLRGEYLGDAAHGGGGICAEYSATTIVTTTTTIDATVAKADARVQRRQEDLADLARQDAEELARRRGILLGHAATWGENGGDLAAAHQRLIELGEEMGQ